MIILRVLTIFVFSGLVLVIVPRFRGWGSAATIQARRARRTAEGVHQRMAEPACQGGRGAQGSQGETSQAEGMGASTGTHRTVTREQSSTCNMLPIRGYESCLSSHARRR